MDRNLSSKNHSLEAKLYEAAPQAAPAFRQTLRSHLLDNIIPAQNSELSTQWLTRRLGWRLAAAAALIVCVLVVLVFTPAGRALAAMLSELGPFNFTAAPSKAEEIVEENRLAEDSAVSESIQMGSRRFATTAEASQEAGFPVMVPSDVPAGYINEGTAAAQAKPIEIIYNSRGGISHITVDFVSEDFEHVLSYMQVPYTPDPARSPFEVGVGDAIVTDVTVNGAQGVFLEDYNNGTRINETEELVAVPYNVLIWQQPVDGQHFLFWLHSSEQLPRSRMLAVAESVAP